MTLRRISCSFRTVSLLSIGIPPLVVAGAPGKLMGLWLFRPDRSILNEQLVLARFQNGLDAFLAGEEV